MHLAAISIDAPWLSTKLAEITGARFPLLSDEERKLIRAYGVLDEENDVAWPAIFYVKDGKVAWRSLAESTSKRAGVDEILTAIGAR